MKSNNKSDASRKVRNLTRKSFTVGGIVAALLVLVWLWIGHQPKVGGIPWILRTAHELSGRIWIGVFSPNRFPPTKSAPPGAVPRVNGDLGLDDSIDLKKWRLQIYQEDKPVHELSMTEIRLLPPIHTATEFYCIEGWSTQFSYAGVRFSDFMKAYGLSNQYRYVGLETPDKEYYVSIDMESMLHSQTLLAYEMNERPLSEENGFPLRLVIPIKYGIKSLKRIGALRFSNTRPPDYWAERGYDWYSGL